MTKHLCETCAAYSRLNEFEGECRAKPPRGSQGNPNGLMRGSWPRVAPNDWCLEHSREISEDEQPVAILYKSAMSDCGECDETFPCHTSRGVAAAPCIRKVTIRSGE